MTEATQSSKKVDFFAKISNKIESLQEQGDLKTPDNYNTTNALEAAKMALRDVKNIKKVPAMKACSPSSIYESLLSMVMQGLNPAMKQCYFIVSGDRLILRRSYFGTATALLRLPNVKKVRATVVHEGDEFEIGADDNFDIVIKHFNPSFKNLDNPISAAFAIIDFDDGYRDYTIMTKKEIDQAWSKSRSRTTQREFPQEMAKRTVLNRAAKMYVNTADDDQLVAGAIATTTANEYKLDDGQTSNAPHLADQLAAKLKEKKTATVTNDTKTTDTEKKEA